MSKIVLPPVLVLVVSLWLAVPSFAVAVAPGDVPLDLASATGLALERRGEMDLAREKERLALSVLKEAEGNFLPTLDLTGSSSYTRNFDRFSGVEVSADIGGQDISARVENTVPSYMLQARLELLLNLWSGGRDQALLGQARDKLAAQRHHAAVTRRRIEAEVGKAYWGLKKAKLHYRMAARDARVSQRELRVARTRNRAGRLSEVELAEAVLAHQEKQTSLGTADRRCLRAFRGFLRVLAIPAEEDGAGGCHGVPTLADAPDVGRAGDQGEESHPEIAELASDIAADIEGEQVQRAEFYPKIDFFSRYDLVGRDTNSYFQSWRDAQSADYVVGIRLSLNLFNGMRTRERIHQARSKTRLKRLRLQNLRRRLAEASDAARTALAACRDRLSLARARGRLERAHLKLAEGRLADGRISRLAYRRRVAAEADASDAVTIAEIEVVLARDALIHLVVE